MRTILAGIRVLRRTPLALCPLAAQGLVVALLIGVGAFPAAAPGAPASAAFPLDLYFDVKQSLAFGEGWAWVIAAVGLSVLVRGAVLAATLWIGDGAAGPFLTAWIAACRLGVRAAVSLFPAAGLFFVAAATRYAPFAWLAAAAGIVPAALMARKAARLDVGNGTPTGRGVPEAAAFLGYAYLVCAVGAAMSVLGRTSPWAAALLVACLGPLHALFLLGWREHLRTETYPGGGTLAVAFTVIGVAVLLGTAGYDRSIRNPPPVARVSSPGALLLLGGADSTSTTGALADLDPRDVGFGRGSAELLSYRGLGTSYKGADTRGDLSLTAGLIADQIAVADPPRFVLGHSQASLIVDRILARSLTSPDGVVVLSPSPPRPPPVAIPPPDEPGPGKPGGDVARLFSRALDVIGFQPFDIDAPASPTNLDAVVVAESSVPRLAVWALGDSVWLDQDWRRPGEVNLVAFTDHVGATNNARALSSARDFLAGQEVDGDDNSWRGLVVVGVRYAFEPWRPW